MTLELALLIAAASTGILSLCLSLAVLVRTGKRNGALDRLGQAQVTAFAELDFRQERFERAVGDELAQARRETAEAGRHLRDEVANRVGAMGEGVAGQVKALAEQVDLRVKTLSESTHGFTRQLAERQVTQHQSFEERLTTIGERFIKSGEAVRVTLEQQMTVLRAENTQKLDQMRATVDEKLQTTLERRLSESFTVVSERLEAVHKGLGEMQNLATGVGDLKRVLTNVKARGTWGEVQLGTLLEQILTPEQYRKNVAVVPTSAERVEFAVVMPGRDEEVLLPIDCKFPIEDYERLQQAAEAGDVAQVEIASRALELRLRTAARDISQKYVHPPHTTDFAIMFLPTEGLFAEALRRAGLADELQRTHRVMIAGPTTLAAVLNSLRLGFRTLAIQEQSSEVWRVLGAVKTEFGKFGPMLAKVKKKLTEASNTIDDAERRSRVMTRKLRDVENLPSGESMALLGTTGSDEDDEGSARTEVRGLLDSPDMFVAAEAAPDETISRSAWFGDEE